SAYLYGQHSIKDGVLAELVLARKIFISLQARSSYLGSFTACFLVCEKLMDQLLATSSVTFRLTLIISVV
ncbi:MAG: hypothetical protein CL504_04545, partial [Actinobacteria bacterium]|nr:hypothetical protein [Actinomycetota bacterium]